MDDLEGPVCPVCQDDYDEDIHVPRIFKCGHSICSECLKQLLITTRHCPTCRATCPLRAEEVPRNFQLLDTITLQKTLKTDNDVLMGDKNKLTADYHELASKYEELVDKERAREKEAVICGECKKQDSESDIQICRTCSIEKFQWDFAHAVQNESNLELAALAVCSTCAIRKHFKLGHEVLDFYPIQTAHQYAVHVTNLNFIRKDSRTLITSLKAEIFKMSETLEFGEKELDRMMDMVRRAKSTEIQSGVVKRIEAAINSNTVFFAKVKNLLGKTTTDMKEMVVNLAAENKVIETRDCIPESDVLPNTLLNNILGI